MKKIYHQKNMRRHIEMSEVDLLFERHLVEDIEEGCIAGFALHKLRQLAVDVTQ